MVRGNFADTSNAVNKGTNCTLLNNTIVPAGQPWPPEAQAIIDAAGPLWMHGPKP